MNKSAAGNMNTNKSQMHALVVNNNDNPLFSNDLV